MGRKRRHSSSQGSNDSDIEPEEAPKIRSVVKKVKKEKRERKKKKEKREKKEKTKRGGRAFREISPISKRNKDISDVDSDTTGDTLAQRIAAQRERKRTNGKSANSDHSSQKRSSPERSVEIVKKESPTSPLSLKTKRAKAARQASLNEGKDSVRSVIDDVDALLKSSDPLPLSDTSLEIPSAKHDSSQDVMKELDDLINS